MRSFVAVVMAAGVGLVALTPAAAAGPAARHGMFAGGPVVSARATEPVVLSGAQVPTWSRLAATGATAPYPSGVSSTYSFNGQGGDNVRSAHNGTITIPPDARTGVDPNQIAAYRWDGTAWTEVPVQVDQMYPYFLANGHSSFSVYSGTDKELTYAWGDQTPAGATPHSIGEEAWKKVFGGITGITTAGYTDPNRCLARYQQPGTNGNIEMARAVINGVVTQPTLPGITKDDYHAATMDPVNTLTGTAQLNDDDQIAMMAGDAGTMAPLGTPQPAGTVASNGQQITVTDPTAAIDGSAPLSYLYLFLQPGGSHFNYTNGYVRMTRDAGGDNPIGATPADQAPNADTWIDRYTFSPSSTEKIGVSNTGYGPNIGGYVCRTSPGNDASPHITTPDGTPRPSTDRMPRDGMTITTPAYRVYASGRWMVREANIANPNTPGVYGPNLISRWKGRAFQSSPDASVSIVGFEDEQSNWELNAALLGWKAGPVRAIREVWGADSGTNVTKTEIYYRDSYDFSYHVRVHPIPADGLYTSWDFRYGNVTTYYNQKTTGGAAVDGTNTHNVGEVDKLPVAGNGVYDNVCDPSNDICSALLNPEEMSGPNGSMVFIADATGVSTATQPAVIPFYRDDACFDDGTGDGPVPRPYPGDSSTDANVKNGYVDFWKAHGAPSTLAYGDLQCHPPQPGSATYQDPSWQTHSTTPWQVMPFQGAIGEMGLHFLVTTDTDNSFNGQCVQGVAIGPNNIITDICTTEIAAEQWAYMVPTAHPANLISADPSITPAGSDYGLNVQAPLQLFAVPYSQRTAPVVTPEVPLVALLPLAAAAALPVALRRRRRAGIA